MSTWLTYTTVLTMLLHSALGCCWHHEHACCWTAVCDGHARAAQEDGHDHHGSCSHDQSAERESTPSDGKGKQSPHRQRCEGDTCVYVRSDDVQKIELPLRPCGHWLALLTKSAESYTGAGFSRLAVENYSATGPPLRTHLLYQILLI